MPTIWTVGHSNHTWEQFLPLLLDQEIELLVDVRSTPYSRWAPWAVKDRLATRLEEHNIRYVWRGEVLGGKPEEDRFFDEQGRVCWDRLAERPGFDEAVGGLMKAAGEDRRIALMCAEEDPTGCHRRLLVGRALDAVGARILHIRGDGSVEDERTVSARVDGQRGLFAEGA